MIRKTFKALEKWVMLFRATRISGRKEVGVIKKFTIIMLSTLLRTNSTYDKTLRYLRNWFVILGRTCKLQ